MVQSRKVIVFYTDAGGGHRATALALQAVLHASGQAGRLSTSAPWEVVLCNPYQELIADIDLFSRLSPYSNEDIYNRFVIGRNWPAPLCMAYYGLTLLNIQMGTRKSVERFVEYWRKNSPDLVISVMPLANRGIYRSLRLYSPHTSVPFVVLITDLEEKQQHVWFPPEQDYHIVCGSTRSRQQALDKRHPPSLVHHTSGLVVNPAFYRREVPDRAAERVLLGLQPDLPTGCMMYGSAGSQRMVELAAALQTAGQSFQMIFLCGHNRQLADTLQQMRLPYPHIIRHYTRRVPYYFQLSDFIVCKPGPGTLSEAQVSGLRLLVDSHHVLPQEQYNLRWLKENQAGHTFHCPKTFRRAVTEELLFLDRRGPASPTITKTVDRAEPTSCAEPVNRAIFEIPDILRNIMENRQDSRLENRP